MSNYKDKEDATYAVQSDDLIGVVNNAGDTAKAVNPQQLHKAVVIKTASMRMYGTAPQAIPTGAPTKVNWYYQDDDDFTLESGGSNLATDEWTIPNKADYNYVRFSGVISFAGGAGTYRQLRVRVTGSSTFTFLSVPASAGLVMMNFTTSWIRIHAVTTVAPYQIWQTSKIQLEVKHDSGSNLNVGGAGPSYMTMECK